MQGSTRGWVTVNVFWLTFKGPEEVRLVPPSDLSHQLELCPHASSLHKKSQTDKVPPPVHVSLVGLVPKSLLILKGKGRTNIFL